MFFVTVALSTSVLGYGGLVILFLIAALLSATSAQSLLKISLIVAITSGICIALYKFSPEAEALVQSYILVKGQSVSASASRTT